MKLIDKIISHTTNVRVRYAETDKMGYVYNGNYLAYFEVGRCELMRHYGLPYTLLEAKGYLLPLVESHVSYKIPAVYDDFLDIKATLDFTKITSTIKFDYEISNQGMLVATGHTIHSFLKEDIRRPVKPPLFFVEMLNSLL